MKKFFVILMLGLSAGSITAAVPAQKSQPAPKPQTTMLTINVKTATSPKEVCVYIDDVNERCITNNKSGSLTVRRKDTYKLHAVNDRGTIFSSFYKIIVPKDVTTIDVTVVVSPTGITFTKSQPTVQLIKD